MTFRARYRFRLISPFEAEKDIPFVLSVRGLGSVTITMCEPAHPHGHWAVATIDGFENEDEAQSAGQWLGDTLQVVGAVGQLGIDVGFSRSTLQFSEQVHEAIRNVSGRYVRSETHGLMVYEKDTIQIIGFKGRASVSIGANHFEELLTNWTTASQCLSERQRNCAALINDSYFDLRTEGRFILLVSAVEALCDQANNDARYQNAISALELHLSGQQVDSEVQDHLKAVLANAKRQSVRQAYMTKLRSLLSSEAAKEFDQLYKLRSKLVHEGIGRGDLGEAANDALRLAVSVLKAELQVSLSEP